MTKSPINKFSDDISKSLEYSQFSHESSSSAYWTADGALSVSSNGRLSFQARANHNQKLQPLCTQSDQQTSLSLPAANSSNSVAVSSGGNTYVGFRNKKSFRFLGIPYADKPARWVYSHLYTPKGQTFQNFKYGAQCWQPGGTAAVDSEDCLFLNIQTPYIPKARSNRQLRPVLFWIHGGGFTGGTGADAGSDGGNLVSREDVVVVTINYRLSTLGFLAVPGTDIKGNFGLQDQITAMEVSLSDVDRRSWRVVDRV